MPTNDEILGFYLQSFQRHIKIYNEQIASEESSSTNCAVSSQDTVNVIAEKSNETTEKVVSDDESEHEDLLENFFQVWTRLMISPKDGKGQRKMLVIGAVKENLRKKSMDYHYGIIVKLLLGRSSLVSGAMEDYYKREQYFLRAPLFPTLAPGKPSLLREVKQFDLVGQGQSFFSKNARLDIGICPSRTYSESLGFQPYPYFLGMKPDKFLDSKGLDQCRPSWQGDKDFVQTLLHSITVQIDKLAKEQQSTLEKMLLLMQSENVGHHMDLRKFLQEHPLVKMNANGELTLPIKEFVCEWEPAYENTDVFFKLGMRITSNEQPALSLKMTFIADFFQQGISHLVILS